MCEFIIRLITNSLLDLFQNKFVKDAVSNILPNLNTHLRT